ncbi:MULTISPECIES: hypothetical protein [Micromonospora]|uniref:Uncharacterized protein n=1 Tax=Micromonospora solifontis TaxID=2487138 RepID=A0ABX9WKD4_9ACTN|nr:MULTISPECIES: hypothetical protein [Micromonospora]NES13679.1 hypothetical protein [Micromonospora sp. PPF5-17B]NES35488.1 hypothetical protein [Micromonospora solifontis]NES55355.1 hypothetical protein [Micromonospora sp. PPF5-6]RNM00737.1 hypothetical protein EFE23_04835 [Micromonospora solifontis]
MLTLRPVVEVPDVDPARRWPTRTPTPGWWLTLHGGCAAQEVELFLACLAAHVDVEPPAGRDELVDGLLREELLLVAGGLRLDDRDTGATVSPGCCAGLEDWREWTAALDGGTPWLGHDPGPRVEVEGDLLRVWQHGGPQPRGPYVELSRPRLAELLRSAQADLSGFLARVDAWVRITAPLELAGGGPHPRYLT